MAQTIFIVTSRDSDARELERKLNKVFGNEIDASCVSRTYRFPEIVAGDIVISDGTSKTRQDDTSLYPCIFDCKQITESAGGVHLAVSKTTGQFDMLTTGMPILAEISNQLRK